MNFLRKWTWLFCLLLWARLGAQTGPAQSAGGAEPAEPLPTEVPELLQICEELRLAKDSTALIVGERAVKIALEEGSEEFSIAALMEYAEALITFNRYQEAVRQLERASSELMKNPDPMLEAEMNSKFGVAHNMLANYRLAGFYLERSRSLYQELESPDYLAESYGLLATNHRYKGNFTEAAEFRYQALEIYEKLGDSAGIAETNDGIGIIYYLQGDHQKAIDKFRPGLEYYLRQGDSASLGFSYTLMGLAYGGLGNTERSLELSRKSLEIRKKINDTRGIGESYNNLALGYMALEEWNLAADYLKKAQTYLTRGNDMRQIPIILGNLAHCRLQQGQREESIRLYNEAIDSASAAGHRFTLNRLYQRFTKIYADEGDFRSAYMYLLKHVDLKDSLFDREKTQVINELGLQYDTEKSQQEIMLLREQKAAESRKKIGIGVGLGLVIIILFLVVNRQRLKIHKDKQLHEQEMLILQTREALTSAELRNTRQELEFNRSQLLAYTHNILKKNELLEEMETRLQDLALHDQEAEESRQDQVNELLEMRILTDEDWDEFRGLFDQVHKGFSHKLRESFPELTTAESRLFMLMRLNLTSREVARILGVSPDSVKKGRYRLRKKLELDEGTDLQEYIDAFT